MKGLKGASSQWWESRAQRRSWRPGGAQRSLGLSSALGCRGSGASASLRPTRSPSSGRDTVALRSIPFF